MLHMIPAKLWLKSIGLKKSKIISILICVSAINTFNIIWQFICCTSEAQIGGRAISRILTPRLAAIAVTVRYMTHIRATFFDLIFPSFRPCRIVLWLRIMICSPPIGDPFPSVTDSVVQSKFIRSICGHRCGSVVTIFCCVFWRECALPRVHAMFVVWGQFVTPWEKSGKEIIKNSFFDEMIVTLCGWCWCQNSPQFKGDTTPLP